MSKNIKKQNIINFFIKHPNAKPKYVGDQFGVSMPTVYALRKQARNVLQVVEKSESSTTHAPELIAKSNLSSVRAKDRQVGGDHYKSMGVEPWDVVDTWPRDQRIGFYRGGAVKYLMRMGSKDESPMEVAKGQHYLQKLLEVLGDAE